MDGQKNFRFEIFAIQPPCRVTGLTLFLRNGTDKDHKKIKRLILEVTIHNKYVRKTGFSIGLPVVFTSMRTQDSVNTKTKKSTRQEAVYSTERRALSSSSWQFVAFAAAHLWCCPRLLVHSERLQCWHFK